MPSFTSVFRVMAVVGHRYCLHVTKAMYGTESGLRGDQLDNCTGHVKLVVSSIQPAGWCTSTVLMVTLGPTLPDEQMPFISGRPDTVFERAAITDSGKKE